MRGSMLRGKLNFVDLAGSERWSEHVEMSDVRVNEMTSINQSLSSLITVVASLTDDKRTHIPYRYLQVLHVATRDMHLWMRHISCLNSNMDDNVQYCSKVATCPTMETRVTGNQHQTTMTHVVQNASQRQGHILCSRAASGSEEYQMIVQGLKADTPAARLPRGQL